MRTPHKTPRLFFSVSDTVLSFLFRCLALLLIFSLAAPSPSFALRDSIEDDTPARISQRLTAGPSTRLGAGMEEIRILVTSTIRLPGEGPNEWLVQWTQWAKDWVKKEQLKKLRIRLIPVSSMESAVDFVRAGFADALIAYSNFLNIGYVAVIKEEYPDFPITIISQSPEIRYWRNHSSLANVVSERTIVPHQESFFYILDRLVPLTQKKAAGMEEGLNAKVQGPPLGSIECALVIRAGHPVASAPYHLDLNWIFERQTWEGPAMPPGHVIWFGITDPERAAQIVREVAAEAKRRIDAREWMSPFDRRYDAFVAQVRREYEDPREAPRRGDWMAEGQAQMQWNLENKWRSYDTVRRFLVAQQAYRASGGEGLAPVVERELFGMFLDTIRVILRYLRDMKPDGSFGEKYESHPPESIEEPLRVYVQPLIGLIEEHLRLRTAGLEEGSLKPEDIRILVVEDDEFTQRLIVKGLKELCGTYGIFPEQIHAVSDAQEAVAWIFEHKPQLIVTDFSVLSGTGRDVAEAAIEVNPAAVTILVSGLTPQWARTERYKNRLLFSHVLEKRSDWHDGLIGIVDTELSGFLSAGMEESHAAEKALATSQ